MNLTVIRGGARLAPVCVPLVAGDQASCIMFLGPLPACLLLPAAAGDAEAGTPPGMDPKSSTANSKLKVH